MGSTWGNPSFLDSAYMDDVELRDKSNTSPTQRISAKDRRKKVVSEQHVRERKSNATKQFSYNKLKNETHANVKHDNKQNRISSPPKRPPQPNVQNEGMLIDLSSPQDTTKAFPTIRNNSIAINESILDAPIDIPTEGDQFVQTFNETNSIESNRLEPPPYQSPPTYMNTYGITQSHTIDPFDTSHITSDRPYNKLANLNAIYQSTNSPNLTFDRKQINQQIKNKTERKSYAQLDELVMNAKASLAPKTNNIITMEQNNLTNTSIDSLEVNLSALSINENNFNANNVDDQMIQHKIDKNFLAELEKDIYKNNTSTTNLNEDQQNDVHQLNDKDYTVNIIPNEIYANRTILNRLHTDINLQTSPLRYIPPAPIKMINEENASAKTNSIFDQLPINKPISDQRIYNNFDGNGDNATSIYANDANNDGAIASTSSSYYNNTVSDINVKHNFVAVANRSNQINSNNVSSNYSVTSDIYGSVSGGNLYDIVASQSGSIYYGNPPIIGNNHYEEFGFDEQNTVAIYDEVAGEDILRPHRKAPNAPPQLSKQQIQRRMERSMYGNVGAQTTINNFNDIVNSDLAGRQQKVIALIDDVIKNGGDMNEQEARKTLIAANWDHGSAIRHFKIEYLSKYVYFFVRFFFFIV